MINKKSKFLLSEIHSEEIGGKNITMFKGIFEKVTGGGSGQVTKTGTEQGGNLVTQGYDAIALQAIKDNIKKFEKRGEDGSFSPEEQEIVKKVQADIEKLGGINKMTKEQLTVVKDIYEKFTEKKKDENKNKVDTDESKNTFVTAKLEELDRYAANVGKESPGAPSSKGAVPNGVPGAGQINKTVNSVEDAAKTSLVNDIVNYDKGRMHNPGEDAAIQKIKEAIEKITDSDIDFDEKDGRSFKDALMKLDKGLLETIKPQFKKMMETGEDLSKDYGVQNLITTLNEKAAKIEQPAGQTQTQTSGKNIDIAKVVSETVGLDATGEFQADEKIRMDKLKDAVGTATGVKITDSKTLKEALNKLGNVSPQFLNEVHDAVAEMAKDSQDMSEDAAVSTAIRDVKTVKPAPQR